MALIKTRARGLKLDDTFAFTGTVSGAGGGKIAQVVQAQPITSSFTTSSSSYVDVTSLNASITPSATTSKVLVHCYCQLYTSGATQGNTARLQLLRGSTVVNSFQSTHYDQGGTGVQGANTCTITFLDSPSSSSSVTYKVQIKKQEGSLFERVWI